MDIYALLTSLNSSGIDVFLDNGKLKARAEKGNLDSESLALLKQHKEQLIAHLNVAATGAKVKKSYPPIKKSDKKQAVLSFAQQRLWFIEQMQKNNWQYNMPVTFLLNGNFDIDAAQLSLSAIIDRHEVLRTVYQEVNGQAIQKVRSSVNFELSHFDLTTLCEADQKQRLTDLLDEEAMRPFDLCEDTMLRCSYVQLECDKGILLFNMHHIASDGWSMELLLKEFVLFYQAYINGESALLDPLPVQYSDYAQWQRDWLQGDVLSIQLDYWEKQLFDMPMEHGLQLDNPRPKNKGNTGARLTSNLSFEVAKGLDKLSSCHQLTPFMLIHAALSLVLARHSNQHDIVIGTPVANRLQTEVESLIGFFVNTLVLRVDTSIKTLDAFLNHVRQVNLDAQSHQELPFEQLVELLKVPRSQAYTPLFQIMLTMNSDYGVLQQDTPFSLPGVSLSTLSSTRVVSRFDIEIDVQIDSNGVQLTWTWDKALFDKSRIAQLDDHFCRLLSQLSKIEEDLSLNQLTLLSDDEIHYLHSLNNNSVDYPKKQCIHELFEYWTQASPDAVAVTYNGTSLTYGQLERRANRLARYLRDRHTIAPDTLVGLCVERSIDMVVGILAILKSGAAYLPLDPSYPDSRLQFMVSDANLGIVLCTNLTAPQLPIGKYTKIVLDNTETLTSINELPDTRLNLAQTGLTTNNLAYVIYTSGSTGQPKGVMVEHKQLCHSTHNRIEYYSDVSCFLVVSSMSFDSSIAGLFGSLCSGATLCLPTSEQLENLGRLSALINQTKVSHMLMIPSLYQALLPYLDKSNQLRGVIVAGESCPTNLPAQHETHEFLSDCTLYNEYGPTECTVWSTVANLSLKPPVNIGHALNNTQLYVLDAQQQLLPAGVTGELYIGGEGLARGYLNQVKQTASRFVTNPFYDTQSANTSSRLYRTGDKVRYLPCGSLEFVGRVDNQVKIRGFRIEPADVEHHLSHCDGVDSALVMVKGEPPVQRLVAYLKSETPHYDDSNWVQTVKMQLSAQLPTHMVPSLFVPVSEWPLTPNGKVDRETLPNVEHLLSASEYVAPNNDIEQALVDIWASLLNLDAKSISTTANFFELGGHSLLAVKLISRISSQFTTRLSVAQLFDSPEIASLAKIIDTADNVSIQKHIEKTEVDDKHIPLSYAQKRLWYIDKELGTSQQYNMQRAFRIKGPLQIGLLQDVLRNLIEKHEVLRTQFQLKDGEPRQVINHAFDFALEIHDLSKSDTPSLQVDMLLDSDALKPFDLQQDLMFRGSIILLGEEDHVFYFNVHHIASDAWSMSNLSMEFSQAYSQAQAGQQYMDVKPVLQYKHFASWQNSLLESDEFDKQIAYWESHLKGCPHFNSFTQKQDNGQNPQLSGRRLANKLSLPITNQLQTVATKYAVTHFMVIHAVFSILIARYMNREEVLLGTPVANRMSEQLEKMQGFFVNLLVLKTHIDDSDFATYLEHVKQVNIDAQSNQDMPFDLLIERLNITREFKKNPLVQIVLDMNNVGMTELEIDGLSIEFVESNVVNPIFDLQLSINSLGEGYQLIWTYSNDNFSDDFIAKLNENFVYLLENCLKMDDVPISAIKMFSESEASALLSQEYDYKPVQSFNNLNSVLNQQFKNNQNNIALIFGEQKYSYTELQENIIRYALYLKQQGVQRGDVVAVYQRRTPQLVFSLLAILGVGATYVVLDPKHSSSRNTFILHDSCAACVLTNIASDELGFTTEDVKVIDIEALTQRMEPAEQTLHYTDCIDLCDNIAPAYIIYTSGSTGKPKGVVQTHQNVISLMDETQNLFEFSHEDVWVLYHSLSFDFSVWEMWGAFFYGGTLVLLSEDQITDANQQINVFKQHGVTVLNQTPSAFSWLSEVLITEKTYLESLRYLIFGGEAVRYHAVRNWFDNYPQAKTQLINMYGITETTVHTSFKKLVVDEVYEKSIGKPLPGQYILLLNEHLQPVPEGVLGEAYVGGTRLSKGYLNRAELSRHAFIDSPFQQGRLYKTGDLMRKLPNGEFEYVGRNDNQIKIRGFRIELGEIEHQFQSIPFVGDVKVVPQCKEAESTSLSAFVKLAPDFFYEADRFDDQKEVKNWVDVFDSAYSSDNNKDKELDTSGWTCSYRQSQIPDHEMQEWVEKTVERINSVGASRILEIGVGTGMLLYGYADRCDKVVALDLSNKAISNIRAHTESQGWDHVEAYVGDASNLTFLKEQQFDLIIINSVVQYFPSDTYFIELIKNLRGYLSHNSSLLIGDVRNLDLKLESSLSYTLFGNPSDTPLELKNKTLLHDYNDNELLISPSFFSAIHEVVNDFVCAGIYLKQDTFNNEMTRFRYDVILSFKRDNPLQMIENWYQWSSLEDIETRLRQSRGSFGISGFCNERVLLDVKNTHLIFDSMEYAKDDINFEMMGIEAVSDLPDLHRIASQYGFDFEATWSQQSKSLADLIFIKKQDANRYAVMAKDKYGQSHKINKPQLRVANNAVAKELKSQISRRLPYYMVPDNILLVDYFPVTPNGKFDVNKLPNLVMVDSDEYVAPETEIEFALQEIWQNLLNISRISVTSDFFELGGHSLLIVKMLNQISSEFNVKVEIKDLFESSNIQQLANVISVLVESSGDEEFDDIDESFEDIEW
ncbi:amino acid adenylation domain-containing protein [Pseudoalteromonas luteoviolacea]|uniref:non-ribosomal peptide synthetase n=1 Tax=Pseudoalteromonas luteoviolacea TaxID=43657 RepID=UPI001F27128D|nr:non-ribosomal peptide synthetase [Pseudoalteromonas luteoviolacea]MCF6442983.1 amino acid adenylation domain-containing protein [Pseudoalteromonas luteoviolacea]